MCKDWMIANDFETFVARIDNTLHYGHLAGHPIAGTDAIDAGLTAFLKLSN